MGIHDYENDGSVFYEKYKEPEQLLEWAAVGKMIYANGFFCSQGVEIVKILRSGKSFALIRNHI